MREYTGQYYHEKAHKSIYLLPASVRAHQSVALPFFRRYGSVWVYSVIEITTIFMREKSPDELRKQEEVVQLDRILSGEDKAANPEEFVSSLRELRRETGLDPERIDAQGQDLHEAKEYQIDQGVESAMIQGALAGEGNYGLVFRISAGDIPEMSKKLLAEDGIELPDPSASKVLKVYEPGAGRREFDAQRRAYEVLATVENPDDYLRIPRPLGFRDTRLSENGRNFLRSQSRKHHQLGDRAEVIFMDFVEGEDLAERLYDFVLKEHKFSDELLANMNFDEKGQQVASYLKYVVPGGKSRDEGEREFEFKKVLSVNTDKLIKYLRQHKDAPDFPLNADFLGKMKRTVELLHSKGIEHNDLHERNVMVGDDGEGYIIDFGRASTKHDEERPDDRMLVTRYHPLVTESAPEEETMRRDLDGLATRFVSVVERQSAYQSFLRVYQKQGIDRLPLNLKELLQHVRPEPFIVAVKYFVENEVADAERDEAREVIDTFVQEQMRTSSNQAIRNQLKKILDSGWW